MTKQNLQNRLPHRMTFDEKVELLKPIKNLLYKNGFNMYSYAYLFNSNSRDFVWRRFISDILIDNVTCVKVKKIKMNKNLLSQLKQIEQLLLTSDQENNALGISMMRNLFPNVLVTSSGLLYSYLSDVYPSIGFVLLLDDIIRGIVDLYTIIGNEINIKYE